jgi:hypothetical protein
MRATAGSLVYLQDKDNAANYRTFTITADAIDQSGYVEIPVAYKEGGAAIPNGQRIVLAIITPKMNPVDYVKGAQQNLTLWKGTQAAYDAIGTKDNSTVYVVT